MVNMASEFLRRLLKRNADNGQRPKFDLHTLFTCSQMSQIRLDGQLSVHEPWRRHKKKPKCVYVRLYTNDSSPFIAWFSDKNGKKPRGFFNLQAGRIAPIGEFSFQVAFEDKSSTQVYKFNTESWETREDWLRCLREESRKEAPTVQNLHLNDNLTESKDDLHLGKSSSSCSSRPDWKRHRRTLSAGSSVVQSPTPQLERCQVQLQRSRSQPHLQKVKLVRKRASVLEKQKPSGVGQRVKASNGYVRSPEVSRS